MSGPTRAVITAVVHSAITTILPGLNPADIDPSMHLRDFGADSVERVEIILAIIDRLGVRRQLSVFSDISTVAGLIDYLCEAQA